MKTLVKNFSLLEQCLKEEYNIELDNIAYTTDDEVRFKVKGLKSWLFGAWVRKTGLTAEKEYYWEVFCQYERFIDKFKPSRSAFSMNIEPPEVLDPTIVIDEKMRKTIDATMTVYKLYKVINFIKNHEAMALIYEDDITQYEGELKAKWLMFKYIATDEFNKWSTKRVHKKLHRWAAIFSYLKCIDVAYCPDKLNKDSKWTHINDRWIVLPYNRLGGWVAAAMDKMIEKVFGLGSVIIEDNEDQTLYDIYYMAHWSKKYELEKAIENEDGTIAYDMQELWAIANQMDSNGDIMLYGEWE